MRSWFARTGIRVLVLACCSVGACGETGQDRVQVALSVQGTDQTSLELPGAVFSLTRAQVAVGPVYFCASEGADTELCEAALAELTQAVIIDGLKSEPEERLAINGTTGEIRSALYDYGVSWFLTQEAPTPLEGVAHSAVLEGSVTQGERSLRFVAEVDVLPRTRGSSSVHGQATEHELGKRDRLTLRINPYLWLRPIDVEQLFALDTEGNGEVRIEKGSQAYEAILQSMQNRAPVQFEWE